MGLILKIGVMRSSYFRQWLGNNANDAVRASPHPTALSTLTRVNISEAGEPLLTSSARADGDAYRTSIYDNELDGVAARIERIIAENSALIHQTGNK